MCQRTAIAKSLLLSLRNSLVHGLLEDLINAEIIVVLAPQGCQSSYPRSVAWSDQDMRYFLISPSSSPFLAMEVRRE